MYVTMYVSKYSHVYFTKAVNFVYYKIHSVFVSFWLIDWSISDFNCIVYILYQLVSICDGQNTGLLPIQVISPFW